VAGQKPTVPKAPLDGAPISHAPLGDAEFAALMAQAGPFEAEPHIAVAVSGGPDSMALTLLAARWAAARSGRVSALTVDHQLRAESAAEARQVGAWLRARAIEHKILNWRGLKPSTGVQDAAREARIELLLNWCSRAGVIHLLYAHQQDDQAVTLLQRLTHGSAPDGLSGMPVAQVRPHGPSAGVRLLRPLLGTPRGRLLATLADVDQDWIEDPSNQAVRFARARLEQSFTALADEGLSVERLARLAARAGEDRAAFDGASAAWLACHASPHPAGFVMVDRQRLAAAPRAILRRILSQLIITVGGNIYPPRGNGIDGLVDALAGEKFSGSTLGGCRVVPRGGRILICREQAAIKDELTLRAGQRGMWDGRFVAYIKSRRRTTESYTVRHLGIKGVVAARAMAGNADIFSAVPAPVRPTLPAYFDLDGLVALPHINFMRKDKSGELRDIEFTLALRPVRSLAPSAFSTLTNGVKFAE